MSALMTPEAFADRTVGVPWQTGRADWAGMNCYGLVILYFRHVLGIDLGLMPHTDIVSGFETAKGWRECSPAVGVTCFMAWRDGAPTHCGVLLSSTAVLHAEGSEEHSGSVRVSSLRAMKFLYGELRYYRYVPC